jgi:hypothetical protein
MPMMVDRALNFEWGRLPAHSISTSGVIVRIDWPQRLAESSGTHGDLMN